jgi:hypothetical protein
VERRGVMIAKSRSRSRLQTSLTRAIPASE